mgnify:CR=1 FL=1
MKISEFVAKHKELDVSYFTIHRLIKDKVLRENVHYRRSYRGTYEKYSVLERPLVKFLKGDKNG